MQIAKGFRLDRIWDWLAPIAATHSQGADWSQTRLLDPPGRDSSIDGAGTCRSDRDVTRMRIAK
jgi:hypothetical protein